MLQERWLSTCEEMFLRGGPGVSGAFEWVPPGWGTGETEMLGKRLVDPWHIMALWKPCAMYSLCYILIYVLPFLIRTVVFFWFTVRKALMIQMFWWTHSMPANSAQLYRHAPLDPNELMMKLHLQMIFTSFLIDVLKSGPCQRQKVVFFAGREPKSITLRQILDAKTPEQAATLAYRDTWRFRRWGFRMKFKPTARKPAQRFLFFFAFWYVGGRGVGWGGVITSCV